MRWEEHWIPRRDCSAISMGTGLSQTHLAWVMEEIGPEGSYGSLGSGVTAVPVEHRLETLQSLKIPQNMWNPNDHNGAFYLHYLLALLQAKIPLLHSLKKGRWGREVKSKGFGLSSDWIYRVLNTSWVTFSQWVRPTLMGFQSQRSLTYRIYYFFPYFKIFESSIFCALLIFLTHWGRG